MRPKIRQFRASEGDELAAYLARRDRATRLLPIEQLATLAMNPDGTTQQGGYRYTVAGFQQLAQVLAPGLSTLVPELAGCFRRANAAQEFFDLTAAISLFNSVLTLRFELLQQKRLICNDQTKVLEGLAGSAHQCFDNQAVYRQATAAMQAAAVPTQFFGGEVVGRRLSLWYRSQAPLCRITQARQEYPFWTGYYFCNGEATGTSLRGTLAIYNRWGSCLERFQPGFRVMHAGRFFERRSEQLFQTVVGRTQDVRVLRPHLEDLLRRNLKLTGDEDARLQQQGRLTRILARRREIPQLVAADIVRKAMYVGQDKQPRTAQEMADPQLLAARTEYDLFCALLRQSRKLGPSRREHLEHVAYDLLMQNLKL